jgi:hypothetical protein
MDRHQTDAAEQAARRSALTHMYGPAVRSKKISTT